MKTYLFEDLKNGAQKAVNGFLSIRSEKAYVEKTYDGAKNILLDLFDADSDIVLDANQKIQIRTAARETIDWRTAYVQLAAIMAATDAEQKESLRNCTNSAVQTTIRVTGGKGGKA